MAFAVMVRIRPTGGLKKDMAVTLIFILNPEEEISGKTLSIKILIKYWMK